jgi:hypothetical protein
LPWPIKYLLPAVKWFPLYWPNETWEVVVLGPNGPYKGTPPDGAIIPWWKLPKSQWPIEAPWEPKIYGAWPASKISMMDDLVNDPPFGLIKLKMPGEPSTSGNQIAWMNMKIHTRPDGIEYYNRMKITTNTNAFGETKFYLIDENWEEAEYNAKEFRAAIKRRRQEQFREMIAAEIVRTKGQSQPSKDLFV